jgi:hypothetical protein
MRPWAKSQDAVVEILRPRKTRTEDDKGLFCRGNAGGLAVSTLSFSYRVS